LSAKDADGDDCVFDTRAQSATDKNWRVGVIVTRTLVTSPSRYYNR